MFRSKTLNYRLFEKLCQQYSPQCNYKNVYRCISSARYPEPFTSNLKPDSTGTVQEKEFSVRLKSDPDTFGDFQQEIEIVDEGDVKEERYFAEQPVDSQKLSTKRYANIIKGLIRQRKIKEAIDVVEIRMVKEDRVKPEAYIFNLLLGACGRVGYTKKAFMLYNDMKRRGLTAMGGTYTALFNACANSPWPDTDGLTRATKLRDTMIQKGHEPNDTTYNAMIKAFGRCGDMSTAFLLADEMASKKIRIKTDTINFLLQACISDKEAGFRHALLVWRKLLEKRIKPDVYTYNLLLRSTRDCGLGDIEVTEDVIRRLVSGEVKKLSGSTKTEETAITEGTSSTKTVLSIVNGIESADCTNSVQITNESEVVSANQQTDLSGTRPNLLADVPHLGNIVSLSEITKPEERLLLLGGCKGFLENMDRRECRPDVKTFTLLLDCIPNTHDAENDLLSQMKKYDVTPDISFYNMLIKKRSMRCDYDGAKAVLLLMKTNKYRPDVITYGVLALGCKTREECIDFVKEIKEAHYRLNAEIVGAMMHQACYHRSFAYIYHIFNLCLSENVSPNKKFIETLDDFKTLCRKLCKSQKLSDKSFLNFRKKYKAWLEQVRIDESEDAHPWQQYRQTTEGPGAFKVKDTARFRPRHTSLFKVKTSTKRWENVNKR